jgi:hypothetical protein
VSGDQAWTPPWPVRGPWSLPTPPLPSVPRQGARWVGANPKPSSRTDAPPTANPSPGWEEVNQMRRPSLEELQRQVEEDGGCEATDGCFVEPDGTCDHGQPSWLLALGLV